MEDINIKELLKEADALVTTLLNDIKSDVSEIERNLEADIISRLSEIVKKLTDNADNPSPNKAPPNEESPKTTSSSDKSSRRKNGLEEENMQLRQRISDLEAAKLEIEVELRRKVDEVTLLAEKVDQLQHAVQQGKVSTMKMLQVFEDEAKNAQNRIRELSQELVKSQEISKRYENAMEQQLKQKETQKTHRENNSAFMSGQEKQHYQVLVLENADLKREISRLSSENRQFTKRVKKAEEERDQAMNKYFVAQTALDETNKSLKHSNQNKKKLNDTLTKNTAEWLAKKREMRNMEEEMRWNLLHDSVVYHTEFGRSSNRSSSTTHDHRVLPSVKQIYLPKRVVTARPMTSLPRS